MTPDEPPRIGSRAVTTRMLHFMVRVLLRTVGTLAGLFGLATLLSVLPPVLWNLGDRSFPELLASLAFCLFVLLLGAYLVFVSYLVWFRFSPRAVRNVCGLLGLYAFSRLSDWIDLPDDDPLMPPSFLGALLGICLAYLLVSRLLNRFLFAAPAGSAEMQRG